VASPSPTRKAGASSWWHLSSNRIRGRHACYPCRLLGGRAATTSTPVPLQWAINPSSVRHGGRVRQDRRQGEGCGASGGTRRTAVASGPPWFIVLAPARRDLLLDTLFLPADIRSRCARDRAKKNFRPSRRCVRLVPATPSVLHHRHDRPDRRADTAHATGRHTVRYVAHLHQREDSHRRYAAVVVRGLTDRVGRQVHMDGLAPESDTREDGPPLTALPQAEWQAAFRLVDALSRNAAFGKGHRSMITLRDSILDREPSRRLPQPARERSWGRSIRYCNSEAVGGVLVQRPLDIHPTAHPRVLARTPTDPSRGK